MNRFQDSKPKNYRSGLFKAAWAYFKARAYNTFAEALKAAWAKYKTRTVLSSSPARIVYIKADGSTRIARGTITPEALAPEQRSKKRRGLVLYWDLDKMAWRSFRVERLISFQPQ